MVYNIGKDDDFKNLTQTPLLLSNIIINTIDLKPFSILPQVCERLIKLLLIFWRDEEEILYIFGKYELPNFVRNNLFHFLSRIGYEIQEKQAQKPRIHQNELRSILQNELELYVDVDWIISGRITVKQALRDHHQ